MKLTYESITSREPALGGSRQERISGLEPALSREFGPLYGRFHVQGLEAPQADGRRRPRVIVGETDFDTGQLVKLVAESNGYEVIVFDNGQEILRHLSTAKPNLLVVNLWLTRLSGLELIRQLRHNDELSEFEMPILVMDVQRRKQDVLDAFGAGADDYLVMPYDLPVLLRCWQRVCGVHRKPSPLTAIQSEDAMVRQLALSYLIETRPSGVSDSFRELLDVADPSLQLTIRWALRQLGADR